jgi:hypothetical protein
MAGVIYYGVPDREEALKRCSFHLNTEVSKLDTHLQFLRYADKANMDDIRQMLQRIELKADGYAVLFERADLLSSQCQNAILKALEDRDDVLFVFYAGNVKLIGTVESRSVIVNGFGLTLSNFHEVYSDMPDSFFYLSGANEELLKMIAQDKDIVDMVKDADADIYRFLSDKKNLLIRFGLMKEKDSENFFDSHKELVPGLYEMFTQLLIERSEVDEVVEKLELIERHKELLRKSNSYGKNDFLDMLISI